MQYEIIGGGAGARPSKDGMSGTCMNQSNAKIAPVEIIESEFPTRMLRFELIRDSGGPGFIAAGSASAANTSISPTRVSRSAPPSTSCRRTALAGGNPGRTGDILINPERDGEKRLPTRYADYPLKVGDVFRLDTPGGGGYGDRVGARARPGAR